MIVNRPLCGLFVLVTTATVLAGCGAEPVRESVPTGPYPSPVSPAPTDPVPPPDSPTPAALPTLTRATAPPNGPTDNLKKTDLVVGTVTRGGSGPCYGVQTDDGTQYALYSGNGESLVRGTRVKVRTKPTRLRIDCGAGRFLEMTTVELMR
jgi:hypothetical protein